MILKGDDMLVPKSLIPEILKNIHHGYLSVQSCLRRSQHFTGNISMPILRNYSGDWAVCEHTHTQTTTSIIKSYNTVQ